MPNSVIYGSLITRHFWQNIFGRNSIICGFLGPWSLGHDSAPHFLESNGVAWLPVVSAFCWLLRWSDIRSQVRPLQLLQQTVYWILAASKGCINCWKRPCGPADNSSTNRHICVLSFSNLDLRCVDSTCRNCILIQCIPTVSHSFGENLSPDLPTGNDV